MAIIIPSKDIYEINNQKVVDNEVDNIDVSVKQVDVQEEFGVVVHRETFSNSTQQDEIVERYNLLSIEEEQQQTSITTQVAYSYVSILPNYMDVQITINKSGNNKLISKVNTGKDNNENAEIKYQANGYITRGRATGTVEIKAFRVSSNQNVDYSAENAKGLSEFIPEYESKKPEQYSIPQEIIETNETVNGTLCEAKISYFDKGTVAYPTVEETEDEIRISLKCLVGGLIYKVGRSNYIWTFDQRYGPNHTELGDYDGAVNATEELSVSGTYENYTVSSVEFNIYGNTIGINLQDKTVKIGEGQHVYSFSGNELMQTSNKYTTVCNMAIGGFVGDSGNDRAIYSVIRATPALNSGDILIYNGETAICVSANPARISVLKNGEWAKMSNVQASLSAYKAHPDQIQYTYGKVIDNWKNGKEIATIKCGMNEYYSSNHPFPAKPVISVKETGLPMTFHIGDIVIPYIKGADGQDKPISYYMDRTTPKEFLVIGKGITADGEILQELTLQEVTQN